MVTEREVLLIVGPPGSGKSTLARSAAQTRNLQHLEREMFKDDPSFRRTVAQLAGRANARLVIVRTCPTIGEQLEWERITQSTETVVLDVDPDECARRIYQRRRPRWRGEVQAARHWRQTRTGARTPPGSSRRPKSGDTSERW